MRKVVFCTFMAAMLVACGPSGTESGSKSASGSPAKSGELEVAAFKGGYGIDFYETAAKEYEKERTGKTIKIWGNPRVWEQLRPRLISGDAPDLMYPGWGLDHWALAEEEQLEPLDAALDTPAWDGKTKWRDTFEESILKLGQKGGKQYVLPYFFNVQGWWYDPGVFKKNGWTAPTTFPELLALCAKIKAKGIAPITFQGKYPYYLVEGMLLPWAQSVGGIGEVKAAQNLEPGAWKSNGFLTAARMIKELKDKGFFQDGAVALSHTESQTEFLRGKAALIPCGTWLYSEMKGVMPPGADMRFIPAPVVPGGKGDPSAVLISIEPWMVPADAKDKEGAIDFFKYLTSVDKARKFVEEKATLMAIKGSDAGNVPETLKAPSAWFKQSKTVYSYIARQWYPSFETELENAMTSLLNGEISPEQFCDRAEAAAEKVRKDDSITKFKLD